MSRLAKLLLAVQTYIPKTLGEVYGGGYYGGKLRGDDGQLYAIVVAPKAQGESEFLLPLSNLAVPFPLSTWDGAANMAVFRNLGLANCPAAQFCAGLSIGGYTDWHVASIDELNLLYRNFKPNASGNTAGVGANPHTVPPSGNFTDTDPGYTNVAIFGAGAAEQFSTAAFYGTSSTFNSSQAWILNFSLGQTTLSNTSAGRLVRAVRMVRIPG